jgi:proline iminopeptidase
MAACTPSAPEPVAAEDPSTPPAPVGVTEEGLRTVNGTELFVRRMGAGKPVIVVHGGPVLEHGYLLPHLAPLAASHELIFYDQRLSGRSAADVPAESVTIDSFVQDIESLREALGLDRFTLMAHSWGGFLAMQYAIEHGARLEALVLLDSMAASTDLWRQEETALAEKISDDDRAEREALMASEAFAAREPAALRELMLLSFRAQFADAGKIDGLDLYVPVDYMARSARFGALGPELENFDLHEALRTVTVPTLVLYGAEEPGAALGGAAIHDALPNSLRITVARAGHFPFLEQPEAFLIAVRSFLDRLDSE